MTTPPDKNPVTKNAGLGSVLPRSVLFVGIFVFFFLVTLAALFYVRDPQVDLSKYDNVVPAYKEKIQELRVASKLVSGHFLGLREAEGVERLEALAGLDSPIAKPAKKILFYYYSQPERYECEGDKNCPALREPIPESRSAKAFDWARRMAPGEKADALAFLLKDPRIAPQATEADRIALMTATETANRTGLKAATALAFHYLDKRYFKNDMIAESALWLERATEIEKTY